MNLIAKFRKSDEDGKIVISYLPVFGWTTFDGISSVAQVPGRENTVHSGSIYPCNSDYVINEYGEIQKILNEDDVKEDIFAEEENNVESDEGKIDSYYLYN